MQTFIFKTKKPRQDPYIEAQDREHRGEIYDLLRANGNPMPHGAKITGPYYLHKHVKRAFLYPTLVILALVLIILCIYTEAVSLLQALVLVVLVFLLSRHSKGKRALHFIVLKIPVTGQIIREAYTAQTARMLSSLGDAGIDIFESLRLTRDSMGNVHYRTVLERAEDAIRGGDAMSSVFIRHTHAYPVFFGELVAAGEETGDLSGALGRAAAFYETRVSQKTTFVSSLIAPFFMSLLGIAVGLGTFVLVLSIVSFVSTL